MTIIKRYSNYYRTIFKILPISFGAFKISRMYKYIHNIHNMIVMVGSDFTQNMLL